MSIQSPNLVLSKQQATIMNTKHGGSCFLCDQTLLLPYFFDRQRFIGGHLVAHGDVRQPSEQDPPPFLVPSLTLFRDLVLNDHPSNDF